MILNTGSRTDIPAFYSEWFYSRVKAGYVLARNPYYPEQVTRYELDPEVVDALVFCTKNPAPMFRDFGLLRRFSTFWFVTITPYGKDIEPFVPDKGQVVASFLRLSALVRPGVDADGCLSQKVLETALGCKLSVPKKKGARPKCPCLLGADIGAYNTCGHGCLYCYANYDRETVRRNMARHRKTSPFLVGGREPGDIIKSAKQSSWREPQLNLFDAGGA